MITLHTFEILEGKCGSHTKAAAVLGVSVRRYREWRRSIAFPEKQKDDPRLNIPKNRQKQIEGMAEEIEGSMQVKKQKAV